MKPIIHDALAIAAIRATAIDGTNKAKSGHPGMAIGSAPALYTLFTRHLVTNPHEPTWVNRDRFVLSSGHASMLLYTLLHLAGFNLPLDELKRFRQIDSKTPGHPEVHHTCGVDATTGPLGQGFAQAVGMAVAEASMGATYQGKDLINHYTYALCGDGDMQEGVTQEVASFAGHQKLNKLIVMYDANNVTLDGALDMSFSEDVEMRFKALKWQVLRVNDGNDIEAIDKALKKAKKSLDKPTLIIMHTMIGQGSKNQGTFKVHGNPLGEEDGAMAKQSYGYTYPAWEIPSEAYEAFANTLKVRGLKAYRKWKKALKALKLADEKTYKNFVLSLDHKVDHLIPTLPTYPSGHKDSTRNTSGEILNLFNQSIFNLIGGSADVAHSVMTGLKHDTNFTATNRIGRNVHFGIREFGMAAIQNGMLLHGGLRTYAGCFLVFADYMKNGIRMAALSELPAIYLFSHDSIAVGEDGPTHQPIEQCAMLRSIPNVDVYRPCDARETAASWKLALLSKKTPSALILSRQALPSMDGTNYEGVEKGAYIVSKEMKHADFVIIATGSEVALAIDAQRQLRELNIDTRVVSMPSMERFSRQTDTYQLTVLGKDYSRRVAVEMLTSFGWHRYAKTVMSMDQFGTSAPASDAIKKFDFTSERLVKIIQSL